MRIAFLSPSLIFLHPTRNAAALARLLATLARDEHWDSQPGTAWESADVLGSGEARALTFELAAPAHDRVSRIGASWRVLHHECWLNGRVAHASLLARTSTGRRRPGALLVGRVTHRDAGGSENATAVAAGRAWAAALHYHNGDPLSPVWSPLQLPWRHQLERTLVDPIMGAPLKWESAAEAARHTRCNATVVAMPSRTSVASPRPLRLLVPADSQDWPVATQCMQSNASREMCEVVQHIAVDRAIMAAVANRNIATDACVATPAHGRNSQAETHYAALLHPPHVGSSLTAMCLVGRLSLRRYLGRYTDLVTKTAKVPNFLVIALDATTGEYLRRRGVAHYVRRLKTRTGSDSSTTDNHATSALKFVLLAELLRAGVSVLLTDVGKWRHPLRCARWSLPTLRSAIRALVWMHPPARMVVTHHRSHVHTHAASLTHVLPAAHTRMHASGRRARVPESISLTRPRL